VVYIKEVNLKVLGEAGKRCEGTTERSKMGDHFDISGKFGKTRTFLLTGTSCESSYLYEITASISPQLIML
jgi:hypothetical protein